MYAYICLGPLLNHIMKRGRLTERETSLIVRDIANGLNFLHSKGMSHRFEYINKIFSHKFRNIFLET